MAISENVGFPIGTALWTAAPGMPVLSVACTLLEFVVDLFLDLPLQLLQLCISGLWSLRQWVICSWCCRSARALIVSVKFEMWSHIFDFDFLYLWFKCEFFSMPVLLSFSFRCKSDFSTQSPCLIAFVHWQLILC